jgi:phosphotransferase system  glucose/maltose/N-acetylglucosamine-specific IIC component
MFQPLIASIVGLLIVIVTDVAKHITHFDIKKWFSENYERIIVTTVILFVFQLVLYLVPEAIIVIGNNFGVIIEPDNPAAHVVLGAAVSSYTLISAKKKREEIEEIEE